MTRPALIVQQVIERATEGDWSKLMGRCTEAQLIGFQALREAGREAWMVCGSYQGEMDGAARELFQFDIHSWLECEGHIIDPTRWVFQFETALPQVDCLQADHPDYQLGENGFRTQQWQPHFREHLHEAGFQV